MSLRVVSWNMGTVTRFPQERAWHFLMAVRPDIALLQEAKPTKWLDDSYRALHYPPMNRWGSIVLVRTLSADLIQLAEDSLLSRLGGYVATARVEFPTNPTTFLASVHTRAQEVHDPSVAGLDVDGIRRPMNPRPYHNDLAFHALAEMVGSSSFIIGGDWNTSRLFDRDPRHSNASVAFFERAQDRGWVECMWKQHGKEVRTWFRKGDRQYQLDHLFCSPDLADRLRSCEVLSEAAEKLRLSDHAPILAEFDLETALKHPTSRAESCAPEEPDP